MRRRALALTLILFAAPLGAAVSFDSPKGRFRVQVTEEGSQGRDMIPLAVILSPADGEAPLSFLVQWPGYKAPTEGEMRGIFLFSPDETSVAVLNARSLSIRGYRLVALARQRWEAGNLDAESVEWIDDARLVFRGQDDHSFFIGVFDAKSGTVKKINPALSLNTSFEVVKVTPKSLVIREEDRQSGQESCYSFDLKKEKRKNVACP